MPGGSEALLGSALVFEGATLSLSQACAARLWKRFQDPMAAHAAAAAYRFSDERATILTTAFFADHPNTGHRLGRLAFGIWPSGGKSFSRWSLLYAYDCVGLPELPDRPLAPVLLSK